MPLFETTYAGKAKTTAPTPQSKVTYQSDVTASDTSTAASIANGDAAAAATAVNNLLASSLAQNSAKNGTVKTGVRDPLKSAFSGKKSPTTQGFMIDPTTGSVNDLNLSDSLSGDLIDRAQLDQLVTLASRFGVDTPSTDGDLSSLMGKAGDAVRSTMLDGTFTDMGGIEPPANLPEIDTSDFDEELAVFADFATKTLRGEGITSTAMISDIVNKGFTEGLSAVTDAAGDLIADLPGTIDPDLLNALKKVGASIFDLATDSLCGNYYPFRSRQNLFNGLVGLTAREGILCALATFLTHANSSHSSTLGVLRSSATTAANRGMANIVFTIAEHVGPGSLKDGLGLAEGLIRKGVVDEFDVPAIEAALDSLNVDAIEMVSDTPAGFGMVIWDEGKVSAADGSTIDALTGESISHFTDRSEEIEIDRWIPSEKLLTL